MGRAHLRDLILQLHAAAAAPGQWPGVMERLAGMLRCEHAILLTRASWRGNIVLWASAGLDVCDQERFRSPYSAEVGRPLFEAAPPGVACPRHHFISDREFERSDFYNHIVRPANGFRSLNAVLGVPTGKPTLVGFCRPRSAPDFHAGEAALLQSLLPHFSAALELSLRLRAAQSSTQSLRALLDALGCAVILVDASCQPHFINRRATHVLAERDGLFISRGGLGTACTAKTSVLRAAVVEATACARLEGSGTSTRRLLVNRHSARAPWLLSVVPVSYEEGFGGTSVRAAAIFIEESDQRARIDTQAVAEGFGLTAREATVAALVASGIALGEIARTLDIGVGTVRTHLKHVFEKTGTRSQTALALRLQPFARPTVDFPTP